MNELHINDLFWTLQGEGLHSGRRALFVRLPFCNYDCPWCDTEYNSFRKIKEEEFIHFAQKEEARFAVITGGEPLAHKHLPGVIKLLKKMGFEIACETNGSLPAPEDIDFITCSPKKYTKDKLEPYFVHPDLYKNVSEFKYVVEKDFDFKRLERHKDDDHNVRLSLSPEYGDMRDSVQKILSFIKENPRWRLSLQTHKWIDIP